MRRTRDETRSFRDKSDAQLDRMTLVPINDSEPRKAVHLVPGMDSTAAKALVALPALSCAIDRSQPLPAGSVTSQVRPRIAARVTEDLAEAEEKVGTLYQQLVQASHKAEQTVLTAPVDGTLQQLAVHTVGGVVTPAQPLLTVVLNDEPVLLEVMVDNADIGFIHAGQDVAVKVQTFEFTRYGLLHGHVVDVSHDRVAEQSPAEQRPSGDKASDQKSDDDRSAAGGYVAHVALDSARMVIDGQEQAIAPGMAVTAEIKTGRRSVITYLLSPLRRYAHEGIRER